MKSERVELEVEKGFEDSVLRMKNDSENGVKVVREELRFAAL